MALEQIPVGSTFNYEKQKYHVVTQFTDCDNLIYVVKYYGHHKQWWHYKVLDHKFIGILISLNLITNLKRKKNVQIEK